VALLGKEGIKGRWPSLVRKGLRGVGPPW